MVSQCPEIVCKIDKHFLGEGFSTEKILHNHREGKEDLQTGFCMGLERKTRMKEMNCLMGNVN